MTKRLPKGLKAINTLSRAQEPGVMRRGLAEREAWAHVAEELTRLNRRIDDLSREVSQLRDPFGD